MKVKTITAGCVVGLVLLLILSSSGAETNAQNFPSTVLPRNRYDFGVIGEGIEMRHDFVIQNNGAAALIIKPIEPG